MRMKPLNNRGMLLIEVVIAVGIMGIITLAMLSMMDIVNSNSSKMNVLTARNQLINSIKLNSLSSANLEKSAAKTKELGADGITPNIGSPNSITYPSGLENCLPSIATATGCSKASLEDVRGNRFYLTDGNSNILAGQDIFYTINGVKCDQTKAANANECPLASEVWFEPFCLDFKESCNKALSVTVRYKLSLRSDYTGKLTIPPIEGESYVPLGKGTQITRVLDQNNAALAVNNYGIYTLQKIIGLPDQTTLPQGIKFEVTLGNPTGLVSMKLQYRRLTGPSAFGTYDEAIPAGLLEQSWQDVPDPATGTGTWSVTLAGARPNQIINIGTQATATSNPVSPGKSFKIGATSADTAAVQATYLWTVNTTTGIISQPTFKSGFYQFRMLSTVQGGATVESINYVTIRLVPRVQFLTTNPVRTPTSGAPFDDNERNCTANDTATYTYYLADDEGIGLQTATIDGNPVDITQISGTNGSIQIPFKLNQAIVGANQNFNFVVKARNGFTGRTVGSVTFTEETQTKVIKLKEKAVQFSQIIQSVPAKIRINSNAVLSSTLSMGSCCSEVPTATWSYPNVSEVGSVPMLSGPSSSGPVTCTTDEVNNLTSCSSSVSAEGILEGPTTGTPDARVVYSFASSSLACTNGTLQDSRYFQVIRIPGIQFYLSESLWLTVPGSPLAPAIKTINPRLVIRSDFDPDEDVTVRAVRATDSSEICTVTFTAGTGVNPVDRFCNIPAGYSGDIVLQKVSANIQTDVDPNSPTYRAKLVTGKLNHRVCQADLSTVFPTHTVTSAQPMLNSPWGYTGPDYAPVQDPKNDSGLWNVGDTKPFRCYDTWTSAIGSSTFTNNDTNNVQDIYDLFRYNSGETRVPITSPLRHRDLGLAASTSVGRYQTYIFANNPSLDFDSKNAPYLFAVYYDFSPTGVVWTYINPSTGAVSTTPTKTWTDYTPSLCTGSAALSKFKVLGAKTIGNETAETTMKATNKYHAVGYSGSTTGFYSYTFMCSYGRWNPFNKGSTNWTH